MKKAYKVNIAGKVFDIDDDAYHRLTNYLNAIERHFIKLDEAKEIVADIEARFAELFTERLTKYKEAITFEDVEAAIKIMGSPEDISDGATESENVFGSQTSPKGNRRIYRDPDNIIVAGVAGGISAYFGIDALLVRILFVLSLFFVFGPFLYLILWIVLPRAETTAQKIEMRGEKLTISNIEDAVKEEFQEVKKNMGF